MIPGRRSPAPRPVSRRLLPPATVLAVALVATACVSAPPPTTTTTTTTTTTSTTTTTTLPTTTTTLPPGHPVGGTVVVATSEPSTLNPFLLGRPQQRTERSHLQLIGNGVWAGVARIDATTRELVPDLVTALPTVANGGVVLNDDLTMTVRYEIDPNAVWEDGTPVTGEDFAFTYRTIMDAGAAVDRTGYDLIIPDSLVVENKAFQYDLRGPTMRYESLFDVIIPKHQVAGTSFLEDWNDRMWMSAGPFRFDSWQQGESLSLVRNDAYWRTDPETRQQLPLLDGVTFRFYPGPDKELEAFQAGDVDVLPFATGEFGFARRLIDEPVDGAEVQVGPSSVWEHIAFQFGPGRLDRNPSSCAENLAMRQAVAFTIDRAKLVDTLWGGLIDPLDSYVTAYLPSVSQDAWSSYRPDPQKAAARYDQAVKETGRECSVVFTAARSGVRPDLAAALTPMFEASGIPFEIQLDDPMIFFGDTIGTGKWDVGEWAWSSDPYWQTLITIHDVFDPGDPPPPDGSNYYWWGTPDSTFQGPEAKRFADLRDQMNLTVDRSELRDLVQEAEQILVDQLVLIPLYQRPRAVAVRTDRIAGVQVNLAGQGDTWNVGSWYRADRG